VKSSIFILRCICLPLVILIALPAQRGFAQTSAVMSAIGKENHCSLIQGNTDNQLLACMVWDGSPERFSEPRQIEIYRDGKLSQTIEPGAPIGEWHFWDRGTRLSIHFGARGAEGDYVLYDTATGQQVEKISGTLELSRLPQWAKGQAQLEDESVPEGADYREQRTLWIAKVLRKLETIQPGMKRKDLDLLLKTEGGLSTRFEITLVSRECALIKVDVKFKPVEPLSSADENPEDVIESVSRPYLAWSIMD
jgi:hypothetical protein